MSPTHEGQPWQPLPETADALSELDRFGDDTIGAELTAMADRVRAVVPELIGLSLGMVADGVTLTVVSSDELLAGMDAVQYLDGGPCVAAADHAEPVDVNVAELLDERRWQLYARASAAVGIASSLSLPILEGDRVIGGVNLYAESPDAFTGRHDEVAEAVGSDPASAVANADLSFRSRTLAAESPGRLQDDKDVNIAIGIIASSQDVSTTVAEERLRGAAARAGITEVQAARAIMHARTP